MEENLEKKKDDLRSINFDLFENPVKYAYITKSLTCLTIILLG